MSYKKVKISDIGKIVSGATPKTKDVDNYGGSIAWITPADLSGYTSKYISHGSRNITQKGYDSCSTHLMPRGTVLFSSRAPIGYVAIAENPICTNQGFKSIVPNDDIDSEFLYYQLQYLRKKIQEKGSGTTFKEISGKVLGETDIVVPSLEEQSRIVAHIEELFSELDKAVDTLKTTKEQMDVYRQAVLKKAFESKANASKAKLSSIGEICLGRQRSPKNISNEYPTKYIRAANITENGLKLDDILEMEFTPSERKKYYLKSGDIVVSEASGSAKQVGKPAIWKNEISKCCFQNTVIRLRLTADYSDYVFWYLKYLYLSGKIAKLVGGVGINHLGAKKFSDIEIPIIDLTAQLNMVQTIEKKMSQCDSVCKTIDTALAQADAMRQSILKQAFEEGIV